MGRKLYWSSRSDLRPMLNKDKKIIGRQKVSVIISVAFLLLIVMSISITREICNSMLHPKRTTLNAKTLLAFNWIFQGLYYFLIVYEFQKLVLYLKEKEIIFVCYMYIVINMIIQFFLLKKEAHGNPKGQYGYCNYAKRVWMGAVAVHSILFGIVLQNPRWINIWMMGVSFSYIVCNLGYFFFVYFKERELIKTKCLMENAELDSKLKNKLAPLHRVYGEDYRERKLIETRNRNGIALLMFFVLGGVLIISMVILMEDEIIAMLMGTCCTVVYFMGIGFFIYCWVKAEKNVKSMNIKAVFEGSARITAVKPFTVQYLAEDRNLVTRRVSIQADSLFSEGMFVKIVLENGKIVRIEEENDVASNGQQGGYMGQKADEETMNVVKMLGIIMTIVITGWILYSVKI